MDWMLTEEQEAIRDLASQILSGRVTAERLAEAEKGLDWFDLDLWTELARAGLVGIAIPPEHGGGSQGLVELSLFAEQVGRSVAALPLVPTLTAAHVLARFGSPSQQRDLLPGVAAGSTLLTVALSEEGEVDSAEPITQARSVADGWVLTGRKVLVEAAHVAERILVSARTDDGPAIMLISPMSKGLSLHRHTVTTGEPVFEVELSNVHVADDDVVEGGKETVAWATALVTLLRCAVQVGVAGRAVFMTAEYTRGRYQFERPLAAFQAVQQRLADAYIDVEAMRVTTLLAAYRMQHNQAATDAVAIAKFWAADAGQRVLATAHHLHGGIGVDLNYALPRYLLWAKRNEMAFGSATRQLLRLGDLISANAVSPV